MTPEQAIQGHEQGLLVSVEGVDPTTARIHNNLFAVGGLVVIPIEAVGTLLNRLDDIELRDLANTPVGTVCFTKNLLQIDPAALTKWQYAAYLAECDAPRLGAPYDFKRDYVVVDETFADEYVERYSAGAPIWGGFTHQPMPARESGPQVTFIQGNPEIALPTDHHKQALNRYVEATNAFDRFLKLYHTLELLFDYVVMKKIKQVGDNLESFGRIMNDYERTELERLRYIIREYCSDPSVISSGFSQIYPHKDRAAEIFQNHTKTGNPLEKQKKWDDFLQLANAGTLSETDLRSAGFLNRDMPHAKFVSNVAGYWIYRIRSSIAHSRVGEFLFLESDEKFITEFAEPLLLDVVMQVFEDENLKSMAAV